MVGDALLFLQIELLLVGFRHFISTKERVILSMIVLILWMMSDYLRIIFFKLRSRA